MSKIENDTPWLDVRDIEAQIMIAMQPVVDINKTDHAFEQVSAKISKILKTEIKKLLKEQTGSTTEYKRKLAMKNAVTRFGGNCRTCVHYAQLNVSCKPIDPEVLGCSYYVKDKSKARSGRKPSEGDD